MCVCVCVSRSPSKIGMVCLKNLHPQSAWCFEKISSQTSPGVCLEIPFHNWPGVFIEVLPKIGLVCFKGSPSKIGLVLGGIESRIASRLIPRIAKAVPEYCWLSRLVPGMALNQGPSVSPIGRPTVLGDALRLSPNTVGSPDWFQEWLRIKAHQFSQSLFQAYSETP